jgi:hypothetical protein
VSSSGAHGPNRRRCALGLERVIPLVTPSRASFAKKGLLLLLGGLAVVALLVAVLGRQLAERPGNGISRSEAIQVAWQHAGSGADAVMSVEIRQNFNTGFDLPTHRWAWVVSFNGQWHLLCSGHTTDRSCDPTTEWVAIDYYSGDWIASQYSYPHH